MLGFMSLYVQHRPEEATFFEGYIGGYFVFGMGVFLLKQGDFWTMALTDTEIKKAKTKGKAYGMRDGSGLYLWITPSGGRL
jgi:hypothetical protein